MRITTNPIGNYSPQNVRTKIANISKVEAKASSTQSIDKPVANNDLSLSREEKNFFVKQYPLNKNEIIDYHFYKKNGEADGVKVGSLIDKRG